MELINFKFKHRSLHSPLVKILVDDSIYFNDQINTQDDIEFSCELENKNHSIKIVHYGKNYVSDGDRSFELIDLSINNLSIKSEIFKFIQFPDLPPWDTWHENNKPVSWENNLHLGHNGILIYNGFSTPHVEWRKSVFVKVTMPKGMQSSTDVLEFSKKFLEEELKNN